MPPTPEQWRRYREEIELSRKALMYWRQRAPECYDSTTEARVAVADHLTECESLLREMGQERRPVNLHGRDTITIRPEVWRDWSARIAALLVSDAISGEGK